MAVLLELQVLVQVGLALAGKHGVTKAQVGFARGGLALWGRAA